jgi:hypothetical protein
MAESYVTYTGDASDDTFEITFPVLSNDHVRVFIDGTEDTTFAVSGTTVTTTTVPDSGDEVLIKRDTDVSEQYVEFNDSSAILASDLNNAFLQTLYKLEEVEERIDGLNLSGTGGSATTSLPEPGAANVFAVSQVDGAGYEWTTKTVAQVQALLGNTPIPTPVNNRFIVTTTSGGPAYELKTAAEMRTLLSVGSNQLPDISARGGYFLRTNSGASAYELITPNDVKSALGLGSAAYLNAGTNVGNLPTLISPASGSTAALPVLSGENLTNVLRSMDRVVLTRTATADSTLTTSWAAVSGGIALALPGSLPSWATIPSSAEFELGEGTYIIRVEQFLWGTSSARKSQVRLNYVSGTVATGTPLPASVYESIFVTASSGDAQVMSLEAPLSIGSGGARFSVQAKSVTSGGNYWEKNTETGLSGHVSLKVTIIKLG